MESKIFHMEESPVGVGSTYMKNDTNKFSVFLALKRQREITKIHLGEDHCSKKQALYKLEKYRECIDNCIDYIKSIEELNKDD